ncbi:MAG: polysaccharide biosynthesis protein [Caldilineaceae bacterium]
MTILSVGGVRDLAWAQRNGPITIVQGDIQDRKLMANVMQDVDLVFHQAALRITQCAAEPRLAVEVLIDGTFNVLEAAVNAGVKDCCGLVSLDLRSGRNLPNHGGSSSL